MEKHGSRTSRGFLLALAECMTADGVLAKRRDDIEERLGVPRRTITRQLKRVTDDGWLVQVRRGQKHVHCAVYAATIPVSGGHSWPAEGRSQVANTPPAEDRISGGQPVATYREVESERSERVAVDRSAAHEPTTTVPAPAVTPCPPNSGQREEGQQDSRPLSAPVPIRSTHVCRRGCHGFDLLMALYDREAAA